LDSVCQRTDSTNTAVQVHRRLSDNILTLVLLGYMILSFAMPVSRDFVRVATEGSAPSKILASGIFQLQFGLGLFAFLMAVIVNEWPKVSHTLSRIFNYRLIMTIGIAILLACIILEAAPIAGWWWTWLTVGLHIATILLAVVLAHC